MVSNTRLILYQVMVRRAVVVAAVQQLFQKDSNQKQVLQVLVAMALSRQTETDP